MARSPCSAASGQGGAARLLPFATGGAGRLRRTPFAPYPTAFRAGPVGSGSVTFGLPFVALHSAWSRRATVRVQSRLAIGMSFKKTISDGGDPGASSYEIRYRARVIDNLHRRAKAFGLVLQPTAPVAVS